MAGARKIAAGLTALAAALALAGAFATPSSAGVDSFAVKVAKERHGTYKKVLNAPALEGKEDFYFRVKSTVNQQQQMAFRGSATTSEYKIRWYLGEENVTSGVSNTGHDFTLKPDKVKIFRLEAKPEAAGPECFYGEASDDSFSSGLTAYVSVEHGSC